MDSVRDTAEAVGCPIRRSADQRVLAPPHGFSQRATSFIASQCQGIHRMPFKTLDLSRLALGRLQKTETRRRNANGPVRRSIPRQPAEDKLPAAPGRQTPNAALATTTLFTLSQITPSPAAPPLQERPAPAMSRCLSSGALLMTVSCL